MSEDPKTTEHKHPITICLDFDGVCNTYDGWKGEDELFEPLEGLEEFLVELKARGYQIFVFSTRGPEKLAQWFYEHWLDNLVDGFPITKPPAVAYVDDRAIGFDGDFGGVLDDLRRGTEPWWHEKWMTCKAEGEVKKALDFEGFTVTMNLQLGPRTSEQEFIMTLEKEVRRVTLELGKAAAKVFKTRKP